VSEREQPLPLGAEALVVLEDEVDEFVPVHEPEVLAGSSEMLGVLGVRAERDEEAEFGTAGRERARELLDLRGADAADRALALDLDDGRFQTQRVAVGDDVEAAVTNRF
jgi:hypothetical protein